MLLLIIPFLIRPISGLYDIGELTDILAYCYQHADRTAQGQNVVNDLIKSGLANSTYHEWSCSKIGETLRSERQAESDRIDAELARERALLKDIQKPNEILRNDNSIVS
jgi:hypothetical protein